MPIDFSTSFGYNNKISATLLSQTAKVTNDITGNISKLSPEQFVPNQIGISAKTCLVNFTKSTANTWYYIGSGAPFIYQAYYNSSRTNHSDTNLYQNPYIIYFQLKKFKEIKQLNHHYYTLEYTPEHITNRNLIVGAGDELIVNTPYDDYYVITNYVVYDNQNDGSYSSDNPRYAVDNYVPCMQVTINGVTQYLSNGSYRQYTGYLDNIFTIFDSMIPTVNGLTTQIVDDISRLWFARDSATTGVLIGDFRAAQSDPYFTNNLQNAFVAFKSISDIQKMLNLWGFPYTFDQAFALNNNVDDIPDYVPDGVKDNPTGGGDGDGDNGSDDIIFPVASDVFSPSNLGGYDTIFFTPSEFKAFTSAIWKPYERTLTDILKVYFNQQPLTDAIINMYYVPFNAQLALDPLGENTVQASNLCVSWSDVPLNGTLVTGALNRELANGGELTVNEYYGSFLDYAPYTTAEIWLPYIGYKQLDVDAIMKRKLSLKWYIDIINGTVTCVIFADGQPINTYTGQLGISLAITGRDYAAKVRTTIDNVAGVITGVNKSISTTQQAIGTAFAGAGAGAGATEMTAAQTGGALSGITASMGNATLNAGAALMQQPTTVNYGTADGENWLLMPQTAHLRITRTVTATPKDYINKRGYPASYTGKVSDFSGFLACDTVDFLPPNGITDGEIAEIETLLKGGVYL